MSDIKLTPLNVDMNTVNTNESMKLDELDGTKAPENEQNASDNVSEDAGNNKETETEQGQSGIKKHVLTYVAGGNWIDGNGDKWAVQPINGTSITNIREYTDEEYTARKDLEFMVGYGAMTMTTVSL